MKVLLVEPNYKNKYPPMGLMKISTYHKNRGDKVTLFKGIMDSIEFLQKQYDRFDSCTVPALINIRGNIAENSLDTCEGA